MQRALRTGIVITCAFVLVLPAAAGRQDVATLTAVVGTNDGFTFTLNDASGRRLGQIAPAASTATAATAPA
jgi:hypothetical protein